MSTLSRYIWLNMLRVLFGALIVLVALMSIAASIEPLSSGMLDPATMVKFLLYTAPSMAQFALPFAAAMAVTLVYVRLGQDNEALACMASGMSPGRLLRPAVAMGIGLLIAQLLLGGLVAPRLHFLAVESAKGDMFQLVSHRLQTGQSFRFEDANIVLRAASADHEELDNDSPDGLIESLVLHDVIISYENDARVREAEMFARTAEAQLVKNANGSEIILQLVNPSVYDWQNKRQLSFTNVRNVHLPLPHALNQSPEYLDLLQIQRLLNEPERFKPVRNAGNELLDEWKQEMLFAQCTSTLQQRQSLDVLGPAGSQINLRSELVQARAQKRIWHLDNIVIRRYDPSEPSGLPVLIWVVDSALLRIDLDSFTGQPVLFLVGKGVKVWDPRIEDESKAQQYKQYDFQTLIPSQRLLTTTLPTTADELLDLTKLHPSQVIQDKRTALQRQIQRLEQEVVAVVCSKFTSALMPFASCWLAATIALLLRYRMVLTVYFVSFMPVALGLVTMNTGAKMAEDGEAIGFGLMFASPIILLAIAFYLSKQLYKAGR